MKYIFKEDFLYFYINRDMKTQKVLFVDNIKIIDIKAIIFEIKKITQCNIVNYLMDKEVERVRIGIHSIKHAFQDRYNYTQRYIDLVTLI